MVRNVLLVGIAMALAAWSATPNLVNDGSFASGGLTNWTTHGCTTGCLFGTWAVAPLPGGQAGTAPPGATNAATTGCHGVACNDPVNGATFSQTLTTVPGQAYTLSFYYDTGSQAGGGGPTLIRP